MTDQLSDLTGPCILIGGPAFDNAAEFLGKWLQAASAAAKLWKEACKDEEFARSVDTLRLVYEPDFGIMAMGVVTRLQYEGGARYRPIILPLPSEDAEMFAVMARIGLFEQRGQRYEMSIPSLPLTLNSVRASAQYLASTWEDEYGLHPEYFVEVISGRKARAWREAPLSTDLAEGLYHPKSM